MDYLSLGLGLLIGCFLGGIAVFAFFGRKTEGDGQIEIVRLKAQLEAQEKHAKEMQVRVNETFANISQQIFDQNSNRFLQLAETKFNPFKELLDKTRTSAQDIETKRVQAYTELKTASKQIIEETSKLEHILRRPDHRGKWGEFKLKTTVEHAQMQKHVDFDEQVTTTGGQIFRPDMVIKLPGKGKIIVDSKLPFEHYNKAVEDREHENEHLDQHVKAVELHIKALADKQYWKHIEGSPDFVVMFVGIESALVAALDKKPEILENALKKKVLLTSPGTLIALLQAAAFGWRQEAMAENVKEIAKEGQQLFDRLHKFRDYFAKVGASLNQANKSYNDAVGSYTTRLETSATRLAELDSSGGKEIPPIEPIDTQPRSLE
ncbi:MAG: DNA recombination protein RmuC [Phycisphaerales bacterium]|nr:DNA recombination protein RmuC [Phycisphaerales bacterium]